ncbi:MAG: hypothetical protein ACXVNO_00235 [Bacteroidia bacterium]
MATIVKSKARVFGECINSLELLQALKHDVFKNEDAPVQISTQFHSDFLKVVCLCTDCNRVHLIAGDVIKTGYENKLKDARVYVDHSGSEKFVTKRELIAVLEHLGDVRFVTLHHAQDDKAYTLTQVFNCSPGCQVIHFDSAYEKNCLDLN